MVTRWLTLLIALAISSALQAAVTANVDRTALYDDETLELTIRADFPAAEEALDLTALSQLFDIVQQRQSTQTRYSTSNGRQRWREWTLQLRPRHVGTLAIPPFKLAGESSQPIMVTVRDSTDRRDGLTEDAVVLNAYLDDDELYIGQTTLLTIELDYQVRLQGNFDRLSVDGFDTELIDESNSVENDKGRQVRRYSLVYRLTASRSGTMTIPDIRFTGQYQSGQFDTPRRLSRSHPGFSIKVKGVPAAFPDGADWLPATSVILTDNLPEQLDLTANEHLDWAITTRATGLSATQLPDPLSGMEEDGFRLYRNAPEFNTSGSLGERKDLNALVFTNAGRYQLPAIRLPWWNLTTDRLEYAELPARTVDVTADSKPAFIPAAPAEQRAPVGEPKSASFNVWPWVAVSLGIGWLATILVWFAASRRATPMDDGGDQIQGEGVSVANLKQRAKDGDPALFRAVLARWLARHGTSMSALAPGLPESEHAIWSQLEASLFSSQPPQAPTSRQLLALLAAVEHCLKQRAPASNDPTRLYP